MRLGVVGVGSWGINHVRVLGTETRCASVVVTDADPAKLARVAEVNAAAQTVATIDQLLPLVDAVVIATPASTHAELALRVLAAGKHVLIEKPFALDLQDAVRVRDAAMRENRIVMVGHLMVFHPVVRRIHELLRAGRLGKVVYVHATRVNLGRLRHDENALWCFGPHDLSMLDFLIGEQPVRVSAAGQAVLQPGVEDVVFVDLHYPSGFLANLHLSWLHPRKERRLTLVCSEQMVEFDDVAHEKLKLYDRGYDRPPDFHQFAEFLTIRDGDVHIPHVPMVEPLRAELAHFIDSIRAGRDPDTDVASALRVTAILDAAQRSLRNGGIPQEILPIPVPGA